MQPVMAEMLVSQTLGEWIQFIKKDLDSIHTDPLFVECLEFMLPALHCCVNKFVDVFCLIAQISLLSVLMEITLWLKCSHRG